MTPDTIPTPTPPTMRDLVHSTLWSWGMDDDPAAMSALVAEVVADPQTLVRVATAFGLGADIIEAANDLALAVDLDLPVVTTDGRTYVIDYSAIFEES